MMSVSMPGTLPSRNGDRPPTSPSDDARTDPALTIPTTGTRRPRYTKAAVVVCTWKSDYEGMDRLQGLRHVVRRIRKELDVADEDVPVLIARNLPPYYGDPFTTAEILEACRDPHSRSTPKRIQSGGLAPRVTLPVATPVLTSPVVEEMRRREQEPQELCGVIAKDVKEEKVEWLLPNWVARGYATLLTGRTGVGKSTFMTGMAKLARRTLWLCGEERPGGVVLSRLQAHGISLDTVEFFLREHKLLFPHCKESLIKRAKQTGSDLIVIDPIVAFIGSELKTGDNDDMKPVLEALEDVAERSGAAILYIRHPGKVAGNSVRGASIWMEHPRTVLELVKQPGYPPKRMMVQLKNNQPGGMQPSREFFAVPGAGGIGVFSLGQNVSDAESLFATEVPDRMERTIIQDCADWLKVLLGEGPLSRKEVMTKAKDENYAGRTVERAADLLQVKKERGNARAGEGSRWCLPDWEEPNPFVGEAKEGVGGE